MVESVVFGAYATVLIRFDGDIHAIAEKLRVALIMSIDVEPSEYPPYEDMGSGETLGWEVWLEKTTSEVGEFKLRMETEDALQELDHGRMHDLSPWLARLLSMQLDLEVVPAGSRI